MDEPPAADVVRAPRVNPFATRFVASARLLPRDTAGSPLDLDWLLTALARAGGSAAIVGGHGTGKSTLLEHLAVRAAAAGRCVDRLRVRGLSDMPAAWRAVRRAVPGTLLCIDSWESLGGVGRSAIRGLARLRGVDLLVTAHRRSGLPTLLTMCGSEALLRRLIASLPGHDEWYGTIITTEDVSAAVASGDIRRAFDALYDVVERRRAEPAAGA